MIGFIKKDLAMIKSNFKIIVILLIIYGLMNVTDGMDISFILPFMSIILMVSTFSYDDFNKWNTYAVTFPNGRKNSVRAKYIATILLVLIIALITVILSFIINYFKDGVVDFKLIFTLMFANILSTILVLSVMYPIIYKMGTEKARIGIFIIFIVLAVLFGILVKFVNFEQILNHLSFLKNYWLPIIIIFILSFLILSYNIAVKINLKKEF